MTRLAVIGAGPSGLSQLRAFQSAAQKGVQIPEIVCYEKQENWGGLWNYTWRTGLDEFGEPVHASMYRCLWSNIPKELLEFPDYSFEEHFGKQIASYLPRSVLFDYIDGRAKKSDIRKWIRFHTAVRQVTYDDDKGVFSVTAHDLVNDKQYSEQFDHVVVATGHFSTPNVPDFDGLDTFNGRVLHAHDVRNTLEFKDKDILIVGSWLSASDIASECWKFGSRSVTISYRDKPTGIKWPDDNWKEVPLLQKVDGRTCNFQDGSTVDVDVIILCTGYLHHFPFMADELRLRAVNRLAISGLYKGVVWVDNPKLFYLGMQNQVYTFTMFDAQAWYVRDIILNRIDVPDRGTRAADVQQRVAREDAFKDVPGAEAMIHYQSDYFKELLSETDYTNFNIEEITEMFLQNDRRTAEDIMTYRNSVYKSLITGNMSTIHHTSWTEAFDDSLESYISN